MKRGYTLVEVLVAVSIFVIFVSAPTGIFISSLKGQKRALAQREIIDGSSYFSEYIGRFLRMAKKDLNGECLNGLPKYNYSTSTAGIVGIRFVNYHYKCQEFYLTSEGRIYQRISSSTSSNDFPSTSSAPALTPEDFIISTSSSKFLVFNAEQTDNLQPRVTIFLDAETKAQKPEARAKIKIQTTVSQRDLDVQE